MNRRRRRALRPWARRALVACVALVALALAATLLLPASGPPDADPLDTAFDWQAHIGLLGGDGHRGVRDGPLVRARFDEPWGLVRGPGGSLFIADGGEANRIRRIAPDGQVRTLAGGAEEIP